MSQNRFFPDSNFTCPTCGQPLTAPASMFGNTVACPKCNASVEIPWAFWGEALDGGQYPQVMARFLTEFQRFFVEPHKPRIKVRDAPFHRWTAEELEEEVDPDTNQPSPGSGLKRGDLTILYTRDTFQGTMQSMIKSWGVSPLDIKTGKELVDSEVMGKAMDMANDTLTEYNRFLQGCDSNLLFMWPAQELLRNEPRIPRGLSEWWKRASEKVCGQGVFPSTSRFIARKDSPIWMELSDFGRPFPPFNLDNAIHLEDVEREDAVKLKLLSPNEEIKDPREIFSVNLSGGFFDGGWILAYKNAN